MEYLHTAALPDVPQNKFKRSSGVLYTIVYTVMHNDKADALKPYKQPYHSINSCDLEYSE